MLSLIAAASVALGTLVSPPTSICDRDPVHSPYYDIWLNFIEDITPCDSLCFKLLKDQYYEVLNNEDRQYRLDYCRCWTAYATNPSQRDFCIAVLQEDLYWDFTTWRSQWYQSLNDCCPQPE